MAGMLIIGAGECGVRAAFALRERGYDGAITLLGNEDVLPYERPPLSKSLDGSAKPIRPLEAYEAAEIDFRPGSQIVALDAASRVVNLSDGSAINYDKALLATGARARLFPGMETCMTLRTDKDAKAILAKLSADVHIGVIGGGFIGLELAAMARSLGARVTVVETGARLLARAVPEAVAERVFDRHKAEGVTLLLNATVQAATDRTITLGDGTQLAFDVVVAGVGALPNTELAELAGLSVSNGILVDGDFRTSDPHVHAAGDCCCFDWKGQRVRLESWKGAQDQGAHAAGAMLGESEAYRNIPWFWSDQYDMTLQVAGLFDPQGPVHQRDATETKCIVFQCDPEGRILAAAGIGAGNSIAKDIRIFEKLIERGAAFDPAMLADPATQLKRLLKAG